MEADLAKKGAESLARKSDICHKYQKCNQTQLFSQSLPLQELALVEEFTVKDAIYYFGTIYKMEAKDIKERFEYLSKLLELPNGNK